MEKLLIEKIEIYLNKGEIKMEKQESKYDRNLDKQLGKFCSKTEKRYLNVIAYSYNGGESKIRITPANKNTNPKQTDPKKQWINVEGISGITKDEAKQLVIALEKAITKL